MKYSRYKTQRLHMNFLFGVLAVGLLFSMPPPSTFAAAGDLDPTFGNNGIVVTTITDAPFQEEPYSMRVQPDGKIVVGGLIIQHVGGSNLFASFFLARYHPDGILDASFGDKRYSHRSQFRRCVCRI